ncbi:aspartate/glutamate racemase family protein [Maribrevibacterium harenarium]|uniref:Aspartate/glutamate racemase family protein n=2 Tax=Maribrevibacterium harenarium TaxID=2589817 RepID=A0A501WF05_9GAMM|nr:aspartate/glutamate racemase family protein [Maribrevibacterium harenarium]
MKTIGILGGMSWESTTHYYQFMNRLVRERLGGLHSAKILLSSVNFEDIASLQRQGDWHQAGEVLGQEARKLALSGADYIVIATNTMHKVAGQIEQISGLPVLHIADATADAIIAAGFTRVGFLGTKFSMEDSFYRERLEARGIEFMIPSPQEREEVHRIIFEELCQGQINSASRQSYLQIMNNLAQQGAQCVIEGCTEIAMLVQQEHTQIPLFDTTEIHARAAIERALA